MRSLYTIILGAMLAMAVNLIPPSDAQAMGADCRCPAGVCSCCCCTQHQNDDPAPALQPLNEPTLGTCTCSTGPNPFDPGTVSISTYCDPTKKRILHSSVVYSADVRFRSTDPPAKRSKPPTVFQHPLYLLNKSLRI